MCAVRALAFAYRVVLITLRSREINVGVLCQQKSFGCQVSHNRQCRSPPLLFILSMKLCISYSLIPKASLMPTNVVPYRFSSFSHRTI